MVVVIAGCGWLGTALGRALVADGVRVVGVRRSADAARALETAGIEGVAVDLGSPGFGDVLPEQVDALVACQAPSDRSVEGYRAAYVDTTRSLLGWAAGAGVRATVYTGSTGVFGQSDGSVVDETTPPVIASPNAEILAEAERLVLSETGARAGARLVRLSGLYGPDRIGVLDRVRRGVLALGPGDDAWMNWCHLDDAVAVVRAALERGRTGSVYHGSDAHPTRRRDAVRWIAERLGVEPARPEGVPDEAAKRPRKSNRRISGERTRRELGVELRYPSFKDGLAPLIP
jgi:nucleoside-diphosphate-sugar epimerase